MTSARRSISASIPGIRSISPIPLRFTLKRAAIAPPITPHKGADMDVKGVLGTITFDGEWITITKTPAGARPAPVRLRAADITGTRYKPGSLLVHGYLQFVLPGSLAAGEKRGIAHGGRAPPSAGNCTGPRDPGNGERPPPPGSPVISHVAPRMTAWSVVRSGIRGWPGGAYTVQPTMTVSRSCCWLPPTCGVCARGVTTHPVRSNDSSTPGRGWPRGSRPGEAPVRTIRTVSPYG